MISVIIPLYNKQKSIISTLQSVLRQTYSDYEIIVVDDGSTDNSASVVQEFIRDVLENGTSVMNTKLENHTSHFFSISIRLIHQSNAGVSAARNTGILAAKGKYVAFLDGDDIWDENFLFELQSLINEYPNRAIYGIGCIEITGNNIPEREDNIIYYRGNADWTYSKMYFTGSSTCAERSKIISLGMFDHNMKYGEDMDMWFRLMLYGGGACYGKPLSYYRQDTENRAMNKVIPLEIHIPYFIDKYKEHRKNNDVFRRFFDQEMVYRLYPYLFDKNYKSKAIEIAKKIDYSQLKFSMHFRMKFPNLYKMYMYLRNLCNR